MGTTVSSLVSGAVRAVLGVLHELSRTRAAYARLLARASSDPGLPHAHPTPSYWLLDPPWPELCDMMSDSLPQEADVVVVGSGIAGAAVARCLLREWEREDAARRAGAKRGANDGSGEGTSRRRMVVLEARQLCSGATGRNGGHIKPAVWESWGRLQQRFGSERARKLVEFQTAHVETLAALCDDEPELGRWAECRRVETANLFVQGSDELWQQARRAVGKLPDGTQGSGLGVVGGGQVKLWDAESAREEFGAAFNALGAVSYPAAALWPSRFVAAVFRQLLDAHPGRISIETHTPATAVELLAPGAPRPFRVVTPRGAVAARHVVHATNAFAPHLVPGLRGKLTGCRAHMTAQRPGPGFPGTPKGDRSWGLIHAKGFDYMTQRPCPRHARATPPPTGAGGATGCGHGDLLLGGGLFRSGEGGMDQIGVWDDGGLDALSVAHLHGILPALAAVGAGDGGPAVAQAGTTWSGTIALTADALPLVGRLDERFTGRRLGPRQQGSGSNAPGEWIAAGYNGEGMVFAWLCGAAAARMVAGTDEDSLDAAEARLAGQPPGKVADWLPHELRISWERLEGKSLADLAGALSV